MAQHYTTVLPLQGIQLAPSASYEFGGGLALTALPTWVADQDMLKDIHVHDREWLEDVSYAFVANYPAEALGSPDPDWKGQQPKSIQKSKHEAGLMATFALWLTKPAPLHYHLTLHARDYPSVPAIQQVIRDSPMLCHPVDAENLITEADLPQASALHKALLTVDRDTSPFTAFRAAWAGLQTNFESVRCLLFWVAIEALFGPEDAREITYRMAQRIGFFVSPDREHSRELYQLAKTGYAFRSKVVHGRWKSDPNATKRMEEAEMLLRRAFVCILEKPELIKVFSTKAREDFLDDLVFSS